MTMKLKLGRFVKNQITFLLFGFGFWLPIAVLGFVVVFVFNNLEQIGEKVLLAFLPEKLFHSGFGIVFGILIVYLSGIVLKLTKIREVFSKIPVLGLFFGQGEIMTINRLTHMKPCLFLYSPTCISYGWILSEEKVKLSHKAALFPIINIYFPNVPTLVTGQVFAARKDSVMKLANSSAEVIDLLLYAFRSPAALEYSPWEDETSENFKERAKYFGLKLDTGRKEEAPEAIDSIRPAPRI